MIADLTLSTEAIGVVTLLLGGLTTAVVALFRLVVASKDSQIKQLVDDMANYRQVADVAVGTLEAAANRHLAHEGKTPIGAVRAVTTDTVTPSTPEQRSAAQLADQRARLIVAAKELGLECQQINGSDCH